MKKLTLTIVTLLIPILIPILAFAGVKELKTIELILPNFVNTHCHQWNPVDAVINLDETFVNRHGSELAPTSCKGQVCWSWKVLRNEPLWQHQIFDSSLPLQIKNTEKLTKTVAQTIKETTSTRKSAGSLISAAQEFINSNFGTGKDKAISKEKSMTESKTQEQAVEQNITPLFHQFLSKGIQGPFNAIYPFCISSAVDLFFKAYETDRVNDLVQAFVIYRSIKPEDVDFSEQNTLLNRAKFLFSLFGTDTLIDRSKKDAAWSQAVLFAKLLEWNEFKDAGITQKVDDEIRKAYANYQILKTSTTKDIIQKDKALAAIKYEVDKDTVKDSELKEPAQLAQLLDKYIVVASLKDAIADEFKKEYSSNLEKAIQSNDTLLDKKYDFNVVYEKSSFKIVYLAIPVFLLAAVVAIIYIRKKKKQ